LEREKGRRSRGKCGKNKNRDQSVRSGGSVALQGREKLGTLIFRRKTRSKRRFPGIFGDRFFVKILVREIGGVAAFWIRIASDGKKRKGSAVMKKQERGQQESWGRKGGLKIIPRRKKSGCFRKDTRAGGEDLERGRAF